MDIKNDTQARIWTEPSYWDRKPCCNLTTFKQIKKGAIVYCFLGIINGIKDLNSERSPEELQRCGVDSWWRNQKQFSFRQKNLLPPLLGICGWILLLSSLFRISTKWGVSPKLCQQQYVSSRREIEQRITKENRYSFGKYWEIRREKSNSSLFPVSHS